MSKWVERRLLDLCDLRAGSAFKTAYQGESSGDLPFIKVSDMNGAQNAISIRVAQNWVSHAVAEKLKAKSFPPGTTVFAKIGEALKQNRVRKIVTPTLIDNNMMGASPKEHEIDPDFLFYLLGSFDIASTANGTALPYLTLAVFGNVRFRIPTRKTQRRIAGILSAYDNLIEVNTRRIAILEEMARRLFDARFGTDVARRERWAERQLGDLIQLKYGRALRADDRIAGDVPVYGSSGIVGYHNTPLINREGIIVGRKGNVEAVHWSPVPFYSIDTVFYVETSWPIAFTFHILKRLPFLNSDAAVPGLNREQALRIPVVVPPVVLAREFERFARDNFQLSAHLTVANEKLRACRNLLLPKLISGEIDLECAEREFAREAAE